MPSWTQDLVFGIIATVAGVAFTFNLGDASDRAARSNWWSRRPVTQEPRFWKTFGIGWLVGGILLLVVTGLAVAGR